MVLEQAIQSKRIRYVFHYDELTWMLDVLNRPFNEVNIPWLLRSSFVRWIEANTTGTVYVWPGIVSPMPSQTNWGRLISPNEHLSFLIFENESDQTRYSLEFVGSDNKIHVRTFSNGLDAYYSRNK